MHHGEDGVVEFFRVLVEVFKDQSVLAHHLDSGKPKLNEIFLIEPF
jgi:hypothetical protein